MVKELCSNQIPKSSKKTKKKGNKIPAGCFKTERAKKWLPIYLVENSRFEWDAPSKKIKI